MLDSFFFCTTKNSSVFLGGVLYVVSVSQLLPLELELCFVFGILSFGFPLVATACSQKMRDYSTFIPA